MIAAAIGRATTPPKSHFHPVAIEAAATNGSTLAQDDLVAQQEMADWAFGAMIGGFLTSLGSFAALYFIRETLDATRETLKETQDRNAIEMRAYIVVIPKGIEQSIGEATFRGQVEIHNIGKSPAHNVSCKVRMKKAKYNGKNFTTRRFDILADRTLLPDARMRQGTKETGLVSDFLDKSDFIYVYGRVDYTDYLKVRHSTMFCHRYNKSAFVGQIDVIDLPAETRVLIQAAAARHHILGNIAD